MRTVRRILVAVDGSATSAAAAAWAAALARRVGAEVVVVHAFDLSRLLAAGSIAPVYLPVDVEAERERARADARVWSRPVIDARVPCRTRLVEGRPAPAILDAARDEHADLIVVGTRGHGSFTEMLLGSVAHELTRRAAVPVVTVPPAAARTVAQPVPVRMRVAG